MVDRGMDAALIVQRVDLFYFSGTAQDAHLLVPADADPLLMVRKSYERAAEESPLSQIAPLKGFSELSEIVRAHNRGRVATLGMELDVLPVNNYRVYEGLFSRVSITDVSPLVKELRAVKSAFELDLIRQAARMNDAMFSEIKHLLREGVTEVEFAGLVEAVHRKNGHQGFVRARGFNMEVFWGHIMSGANLAVPSSTVGPTGGMGVHASFPQGAGLKKISRHEPVQIDHVGVVGGYMADQARTFFLGEPPDMFLRTHEKALEIQAAIADHARAGAVAGDVYEIGLSIAREAGLEEGFMGRPQPVPFIGHGVGLELNELPVIGRRSPETLKEGMVIALEPKFIMPGKGLAGIENTFVVTRNGLERLTMFDDSIQVVDVEA
jgi:Xaa-Pro aminopeptidase